MFRSHRQAINSLCRKKRPSIQLETLESREVPALTVTGTTPAGVFGAAAFQAANSTQIKVAFNEPNPIGANLASNYNLIDLGADGEPGTVDDLALDISSATYNAADPAGTITLNLAAPIPVSPNRYQLTVQDAITDANGQPLDGNADGSAGGDFIRLFTVVPKSFTISGFSNGAIAGTAGSITITAIDGDGSIAEGYRGSIKFTSTDSQARLPATYAFTEADGGVHTFSATLNTAGNRTITATDTALSALFKSLTVNVQPGQLAGFTIKAAVTNSVAGSPISVVVTAIDAAGNRVTGYTGTVRFTSSDAQATLPATYTFTAADAGNRTFSFTPKTAGQQTLSVFDEAITGISNSFQISAAAVKRLDISTTATSVTAGIPVNFLIRAVDAYGNLVPSYLGTIAMTSTDTRAVLPADYIFTATDAGACSISITFKSAGMRTVTVTDQANPTITGKVQNIPVLAAAAARFTLTLPESTLAGESFDVTVEAKDEFSNRATGYRGTIQFASSDSSATVPSNYTFTEADAGIHTFTRQAVLNLVGIFNVQSTDTASASITGKGSTQVIAVPSIYVQATNTIYISGQTVTLTEIKEQLPHAPLALINAEAAIWKLDARLMLMNGATLNLHGTSIAGDVNELRLRSNTYLMEDGSENPKNSVWIKAIYGNIHVDGVKITSWDERVNGPDTNPGVIPPRDDDAGDDNEGIAHQRAFLAVRSFFAADGTTPLESRMDILNSEVAYLGSHASEGYGLTWKALGMGAEVHSRLRVYGDVKNSNIHHNFFGLYMYGGYGQVIDNNEVAHNVWYGIDPHDDSNNLTITNNWAHHNGTHGIILSRRCDNALIAHNISEYNRGHGIMLHRASNHSTVNNNTVRHNGDVGIAVFESFSNTIRNNIVTHNLKGIRFSMGSGQNDVGDPLNVASGNEIAFNTFAGMDFLTGNDAPETGPADRRPFENVVTGNYFHDNGQFALRVTQSDRNTFASNRFENESLIRFEDARGNVFNGNTLPAGLLIELKGQVSATTVVQFLNQRDGLYKVDGFSTAVFSDAAGVIVDTGSPILPTTVLPGGSKLELTLANGGSNPVRVQTLRMWVDVPADGEPVDITPVEMPSDPYASRTWTAASASATQQVTYVLGGLTPGSYYNLLRDGATVQTALADAAGLATFVTTPGSTLNHSYQVAVALRSGLPPARADNVSYNSSTNTITVSGAIYITPTLLEHLAPAGSITVVDAANRTWYLEANLVLTQGAVFLLNGTAASGDVNGLRLRSDNTSGAGTVVTIKAIWGQILIDSTRVTSWDNAVGGPDTQPNQNGRAAITATSFLENGVIRQSTMSIHNSEVSYLGSSTSSPGLLWTVASTSQNVGVLGSISNSRIHHNFAGATVVGGATSLHIRNSQLYNNISHGLWLSFSPAVGVTDNSIRDNGGTGVIVSSASTGVRVQRNTIQGNQLNGLTFNLISGGALIEENQIINNLQIGIGVATSSGLVIHNNRITGNRDGVLFDLQTARSTVTGNEIARHSGIAIQVLNGSGSGAWSQANNFANNRIHDNSKTTIVVHRANNNQFTGNTVTGTRTQVVKVQESLETTFRANDFDPTVKVHLKGKKDMQIAVAFIDQSKTIVEIDKESTAVFTSTTGATFQVGSQSLATTVSTSTSRIALTRASVGASPILVTTRALQAKTDVGNAMVDSTGWSASTESKSFTVTAGSKRQSLTFRLGDLTPGAIYLLKKGGVTFGTLTADAFGWVQIKDVVGTLAKMTYSITPA